MAGSEVWNAEMEYNMKISNNNNNKATLNIPWWLGMDTVLISWTTLA